MEKLECPEDQIQQQDLDVSAKYIWQLEELSGKTIMITGASGYIGSMLVKSFLCFNRLYKGNTRIIALVRSEKKLNEVLGDCVNRNDVIIYECDIKCQIKVEECVDFIFHTASITNSKTMIQDPVGTIATAISGLDNILRFAQQTTVQKVIYLSSMEVYGVPEMKDTMQVEEELGYIDLQNVRSCYPESKRMCECMCNAYAQQYNMNITSARLAQTFGSGTLKEENRVFAQFAKSCIQNTDIVLHTTGQSEGNYVYISDAIQALILLAVKGQTNTAYNIANENNHSTIRNMADVVADQIAHGAIKVKIDLPKDNKNYGYAASVKMKLSAKKLTDLGWKPMISLKQSYERMISSIVARTN